MASIERTAYPRLKYTPDGRELIELYTPTDEQIDYARTITRGNSSVLRFLVLLKTFQCLGYFPALTDVPRAIINHIQLCLKIAKVVQPRIGHATLYEYHHSIREFLLVSPWDKKAAGVARSVIYNAAQVMENPPDLINVAIEELNEEPRRKQRGIGTASADRLRSR